MHVTMCSAGKPYYCGMSMCIYPCVCNKTQWPKIPDPFQIYSVYCTDIKSQPYLYCSQFPYSFPYWNSLWQLPSLNASRVC
uniref:Uncharacterized protein n=1 Tax=Anguilla anguilla TaxID=7936 RepID=A0A0E9WL70_ANGAN